MKAPAASASLLGRGRRGGGESGPGRASGWKAALVRRLLLLLLLPPFPFPPRRGKEAATAVALARAPRNSATHSPQAQHERRKKAAEAEGVPSQPRSSPRCISAAAAVTTTASLSSSSQLRGRGSASLRWPPRLAAAGADFQRLRDGLGAGQLCGKKIREPCWRWRRHLVREMVTRRSARRMGWGGGGVVHPNLRD